MKFNSRYLHCHYGPYRTFTKLYYVISKNDETPSFVHLLCHICYTATVQYIFYKILDQFALCLFILWRLRFSSCGISRKPCSEYKMKEITGSGIFVANGEDDTSEAGSANAPPNKTGIRMYQVLIFFFFC